MKHMSAVVHQLKKEREHTQQQLQRLDAALAALGSSSNGTSRTMLAAGRRKISLAQKARWAKTRTAKPKRTISAAGRKRMAAKQKGPVGEGEAGSGANGRHFSGVGLLGALI